VPKACIELPHDAKSLSLPVHEAQAA